MSATPPPPPPSPPPPPPPRPPSPSPADQGWTPPPPRTFGEAVQVAFKNYATFSGRASQSEFWWFALFYLIMMWASVFVFIALFGDSVGSALWGLTILGLVLPWLAVSVRRLHDTGRSGAWVLIGLIPLGGLVLLVFMAGQGQLHQNKYG